MFAEIRHNYIWGPAVEGVGASRPGKGLLAAVSIDAWKTGLEEEEGQVVANVILTAHGDIVVDFHDNGTRMDDQVLEAIIEAKKDLKKVWAKVKNKRGRASKKLEQSAEYRTVLQIPAEVLEVINGYLQAKSEDEYQGEDNTITYTVKFPDGKEMDIKCCGCQSEASWTEAALFDEHGQQLTYTEVCEDFEGIWELTHKGTAYITEVKGA